MGSSAPAPAPQKQAIAPLARRHNHAGNPSDRRREPRLRRTPDRKNRVYPCGPTQARGPHLSQSGFGLPAADRSRASGPAAGRSEPRAGSRFQSSPCCGTTYKRLDSQGVAGADARHRIGLGTGVVVAGFSAKGTLGRGTGSKRMLGNRVRMSPLGTDVRGVVVRPVRAITRCVSVADTSLSLSLSLLRLS
jgi:hypothetical protein